MKKSITTFAVLMSLVLTISGNGFLLFADQQDPKILRKETYSGDTLDYYHEYIYREDGKLIQENYYKGNELDEITEYTYDDDGFPLQMIVTDEGVKDVMQYECDSEGNIIKRYHVFDGEEEITAWFDYVYDEKGRQVESIHYWEGVLDNTTYYTYDEEGNLLSEEIHYNPDSEYRSYDTLFYRDEYEYDEAGHLLARYNVDENGIRDLRTSYEWTNDYHARIYKRFDDDGSLNYTETFTYDDIGTLLSEEILYASNQFSRKTIYIYE